MNKKVVVGSNGQSVSVTLTDKHYVAAGGEAAVYKVGSTAFRVYHDPKDMIPLKKLEELMKVSPPNVNKPLQIIYDHANSNPIGFTMEFLDDTHPLCKLFTGSFKKDNHISPAMIMQLVKELQTTVASIHNDKCLIVDLNEMNILVSSDFKTPYFIDVGSWKTPSFPATAIMESIRDPLVKNNKFTEESDWYSWAILTFQLYINIHPFKGKHPKYKPADWRKRMDEGVSVFAPGAILPSACNPFGYIPKRHLDWYKAVFIKNERSTPPLPDTSVPLALPSQIVVLKASGRFKTSEVHNYGRDIISIYYVHGIEYAVSASSVQCNRNDRVVYPLGKDIVKTVVCSSSEVTTPVIATLDRQGTVTFRAAQQEFGTTKSAGLFTRNGAIYTVSHGFITENTFVKLNHMVHRANTVENISMLSTKVFDGVVIQDLFGKIWLSVPYALGRCASQHVKQLDGFRILDARCEGKICIVVGEKKGKYHRFILVFNDDFSKVDVREVPDIAYDGINFTVTESGVCVLLSADSEIEVFKDNHKVNVLSDPPFDAKMKLYSHNGVHFINGTSIFKVEMK